MPAKNCIGREQSADLFESLATEILALNCQSASLVVVEQDAFRAVRFPKNPVLSPKIEVADHRGVRFTWCDGFSSWSRESPPPFVVIPPQELHAACEQEVGCISLRSQNSEGTIP
jgi:hypothetical protein